MPMTVPSTPCTLSFADLAAVHNTTYSSWPEQYEKLNNRLFELYPELDSAQRNRANDMLLRAYPKLNELQKNIAHKILLETRGSLDSRQLETMQRVLDHEIFSRLEESYNSQKVIVKEEA